MYKKSKRIVSFVMSIAFLLVIVAGCGNSGTGTTPASGTASSVAAGSDGGASTADATYPLSKNTVTLKAWWPKVSIMKYYNSAADTPFFKAMEKKTNVKINFIHPASGQEQENFNIMVSSGDLPDLISGVETYYKGGGDAAVDSGIIVNLNELIEKSAPNYQKARTATPEIQKQTVTDSGNMVAVHRIYTMPAEGAWYGPAVRKDLLDKAGLPSPVTYDDWHKMLQAFKKLGVKNPMTLIKQGLPALNSFVGGFGISGSGTTNISFFQVDGKVKCNVLEPGYKEYLTMMNQWYKEGLLDKDFLTNSSFDDQISRASNNSGAFIVPQAFFPRLKANTKEQGFNVIAVPNPVKKVGDKVHLRQSNFTTSPNVAISISSACKTPEIAIKYLDYLFSEEGNRLANYGIEGETYNMVNGKYQFTDFALKNPKGMTLVDLLECYGLGTGPFICDWSRTYITNSKEQNEAMDIWDQADNAYCMPPITMTTDEGGNYASIIGDADTYVQEMTVKYIMGVEPLSSYDQFIDKLKSMNIEETIKLQQAAVDRYNSRK